MLTILSLTVFLAFAALAEWLIGALPIRSMSAAFQPASSPAEDLAIITDDGLAIAAT